jgi:hypothetical protein
MRKTLVIAATLLISLGLVLQGQAQQTGTTPGPFFGGFAPQNLTFKPMNLDAATKVPNLTQATMPKTQSAKVFDLSNAFHSIQLPLFRSTVPTSTVLQPGQNNPLKPGVQPKLRTQQ